MIDTHLKCDRCDDKLNVNSNSNHGQVKFFKWDPNLEDYFWIRNTEKVLCDDCLEIVLHTSSPSSCGDKDMLEKIQGFATNPSSSSSSTKRQKPKTKKDFLFL